MKSDFKTVSTSLVPRGWGVDPVIERDHGEISFMDAANCGGDLRAADMSARTVRPGRADGRPLTPPASRPADRGETSPTCAARPGRDLCTIHGCTNDQREQGLCGPHAQRRRNHGETFERIPLGVIFDPAVERSLLAPTLPFAEAKP